MFMYSGICGEWKKIDYVMGGQWMERFKAHLLKYFKQIIFLLTKQKSTKGTGFDTLGFNFFHIRMRICLIDVLLLG